MLIHKALAAVATIAVVAVEPSWAQGQAAETAPGTTSAGGTSSPPGGIPVGPLTVYPGVDLAHGYDDNLFLRPTNRQSSSFTIFSPYARVEAKTGPHKFDFGLRIDHGRIHSSPADNYTDYTLVGTGDIVFSGRAGLRVRAEYKHGHEGRGTTDAAATATPSEFDNYGIEGFSTWPLM